VDGADPRQHAQHLPYNPETHVRHNADSGAEGMRRL
jgi:hypothetical protein